MLNRHDVVDFAELHVVSKDFIYTVPIVWSRHGQKLSLGLHYLQLLEISMIFLQNSPRRLHHGYP